MTYLNHQSDSNQSLSYTVECGDFSEAITTLRHKLDSLGIIFSGMAEECGHNQSELTGVLLLLYDIQKHAAMLEESLKSGMGSRYEQ